MNKKADDFFVEKILPKYLRLLAHWHYREWVIPFPWFFETDFYASEEVGTQNPAVPWKTLNAKSDEVQKDLSRDAVALKKTGVFAEYEAFYSCPVPYDVSRALWFHSNKHSLKVSTRITDKFMRVLPKKHVPDDRCICYLLLRLFGANVLAIKEVEGFTPHSKTCPQCSVQYHIGEGSLRNHLSWEDIGALADHVEYGGVKRDLFHAYQQVRTHYPEFSSDEKPFPDSFFHVGEGNVFRSLPVEQAIMAGLEPPRFVRPEWMKAAEQKAREQGLETDPSKVIRKIFEIRD